MLTLIENGDVFAPEPLGRVSILLTDGKIGKVGEVDRRAVEALGIECEVIDATPLLRAYARWRGTQLDRQDPASVQERVFLRLVRHAARTEFGQAHGFAGIRSVADFQGQVPLRKYEDFWRDLWQPRFPILENVTWPGRIPFFALSSGTTAGSTKYIPVSRAMIKANRRAALDTLVHHCRNRPKCAAHNGA